MGVLTHIFSSLVFPLKQGTKTQESGNIVTVNVPYLLLAFFAGLGAGLFYFGSCTAAGTSYGRQFFCAHRPQPRRLLLCFRRPLAKNSGKSFGLHYRARLSSSPDAPFSREGYD
jgi:hypothetical protein